MMPRAGYTYTLTDTDIINLVVKGKYTVDLEAGIILSGRTGKPLYTSCSERSPNLWVRVYDHPGIRALPVARMVWIVGTGHQLPDGWEVHHWNLDPIDNRFSNLLALHPDDHRKFHNGTFHFETITGTNEHVPF